MKWFGNRLADGRTISLLNIVLIIVPLVCIIFSTIYVYNSSEFIELLVSQPLQRRTIWLSLFIGLAASLSIAFLIGIGLPILIYQPNSTGCMILLMGLLLTIIFEYCNAGCSYNKKQSQRNWRCDIIMALFFIDIRCICFIYFIPVPGLSLRKTNDYF